MLPTPPSASRRPSDPSGRHDGWRGPYHSALTVSALARAVPGALLVSGSSATTDQATDQDADRATDQQTRAIEAAVVGATLDSRRVEPGWLYAALPGATTHGARFAAQAAAAGAAVILTDPAGAALVTGARVRLPLIVVDDPRAHLGALSAAIYGQPAESLALFAVTGTNGKTTTTYLLHSALTHLGRHPGLIGTVETRIGDQRLKSVRTTPESADLHALFGQMLRAGADSCALEISSHALALHRVDAVVVDIAGFTNLSQDHLDFHHTFEEYYQAKAALFTPAHSSAAVVCIDDEWGVRLAREATVPLTTVLTRPAWDDPGPDDDAQRSVPSTDLAPGGRRPDLVPDFRVVEAVPDPHGPGMSVLIEHRDGEQWELTSPLPGDFNVSNTVLAALMLLRAGYDPHAIAAALAAAPGVPGRMEVVADTPGLPLAVVDYAHSPDSIAAALSALRRSGSGPIVIVIGAGGDRDTGKRELMGEAAVVGADAVIVTDDNPRSEVPAAIRAALLTGAERARASRPGLVLEEMGDRREAIEHAVDLATQWSPQRSGAPMASSSTSRPTVLVAGKGHESGQEVAGTVHPFDDRVVLGDVVTARATQTGEAGSR